MKILVINGPNLNMLGKREPEIYGTFTLEDLENYIKKSELAEFSFFQSSIEGEIVDKINQSNVDGIILNAGAYTHYSIAIRDSIASIKTPVIEVHISNTAKREEFRKTSYISDVCKGTITGFGKNSYLLAVQALVLGDK